MKSFRRRSKEVVVHFPLENMCVWSFFVDAVSLALSLSPSLSVPASLFGFLLSAIRLSPSKRVVRGGQAASFGAGGR